MITTCPKCGRNYEETSDETANNPGRLCMPCWHMSKVQAAEREVAKLRQQAIRDAKYRHGEDQKVEVLCRLVDRFICKVTEGMRPGKEYGDYCDKIKSAWRDIGWCDYCGNLGCDGICRAEDN